MKATSDYNCNVAILVDGVPTAREQQGTRICDAYKNCEDCPLYEQCSEKNNHG